MPFHLKEVYFQWVGKGALRIRSFVFCPLSYAFFLITLKLLFTVVRHVIHIEQEYLLEKMENWNALNIILCVCSDVT